MSTNDHLDRMLADLDENAAAPADTTVRNLHAELATLADDLRQPAPPDPHADESALRRAVALARDIGRNPSPQTLAVAAVFDDNAEQPEVGEIGPYKLLAKLGQGGMGTVYKALHTRLEKVVALKVLPPERMASPESVARFNREMKAVGKLEHPHIVRATDAGEADGTHYLVMEYVEGIDLAALLKRNGPLPVAAACELARQAALGLGAAHARGMVHRDVKPANLMLARQEFGPPIVKVLDLGLALLSETHADGDATGLTSDGHIMGTIDFMAPEQAGDSHAVDARADVYSLGATLYALLTGGSIFAGREFKTVVQKLSALATESATPIRERRGDLPAELAAVIHRMLARKPAERYATATDVVSALEPFAAGSELSSLLDVPRAARSGNTETVAWETQKDSLSSVPDAESVRDTAAAGAVGVHASACVTDGSRESNTLKRELQRRRRPVAIAAALLGGIVLLAGILLSLRTKDGEVVVELGDDVPAAMAKQIKIEVRGNGDVKVADAAQGWTIEVKAGKYAVQLAGGNDRFQLDKQQVTVTRGNKTFIRVTLKPAAKVANAPVADAPGSPWKPTAAQQAFFDAVAKLEPEAQVEAVRKKLVEVNPGFDGKLKHRINNGRVVEVQFVPDEITALWPVRGLADLQILTRRGSEAGKGKLSDLSPLKGMKLTHLHCEGTRVSDLSPLKGMPLTVLQCFNTRVVDLSPLAGIRLIHLNFGGTRVSDLSPLKGMPLATLTCGGTRVSDLSPLKGLPLTYLACGNNRRISDLSPLKGMPLTYLNCGSTRISDLSPLKGMPLTSLHCFRTRVSDFSPLRGMPLAEIGIDFRLFHQTDETLLRSFPLEKYFWPLDVQQTESAAEFWKGLKARREAAETFAAETAKLPAEKQVAAVVAKLKELNNGRAGSLGRVIENNAVVEATLVLKGARDITPLMAFKNLKKLTLTGGPYWLDISAVNSLPLEELTCSQDIAFKNAPVLRGMKTLKTVNGQPAGKYLDSLTVPVKAQR